MCLDFYWPASSVCYSITNVTPVRIISKRGQTIFYVLLLTFTRDHFSVNVVGRLRRIRSVEGMYTYRKVRCKVSRHKYIKYFVQLTPLNNSLFSFFESTGTIPCINFFTFFTRLTSLPSFLARLDHIA